ncbi:hypothetical protein KIPB_008103 [Kipferlia bialata]|uniref:ABC transporter domain-containing protein n=1 Tax=Kipferlia bialata TaxID=797122 RepID=A0A9K3GKI8_9EUKA|nr:hypothetical protein KIPB_008103 [Kipferlia bialata]|eukprot:g8103.t1
MVSVNIVPRLIARVTCLIDLGLGYLSLNRSAPTLSGGEAQRLKMARQLGSSLSGMMYILDEPTAGLHSRDVASLCKYLHALKQGGNTLVVVEHDAAVVKEADWVIELGPGAGSNGGHLVFQGTVEQLKAAHTPTAHYLSNHPSSHRERRAPSEFLTLTRVSMHNVHNLSVSIPLHVLVGVAGVAGSGKSTLVTQILPKYHNVNIINQKGIMGSIRGNPVTYTNCFTHIRNAFARATGEKAGMFSFNSSGGCPNCKGTGTVAVEMSFLDKINLVCKECEGRRFTPSVLEYTLHGKNIHEVLCMTAADAVEFFRSNGAKKYNSIIRILSDMVRAGIGYITLGQPLTTLSGGESQRLKLSCALRVKAQEVLVLDEVSVGLHMKDVSVLLSLLHSLVDCGHSVIIIEHNPTVLAACDYLIEMGPEGGHGGGKVVAEGTPEHCAALDTPSAGYIREALE